MGVIECFGVIVEQHFWFGQGIKNAQLSPVEVSIVVEKVVRSNHTTKVKKGDVMKISTLVCCETNERMSLEEMYTHENLLVRKVARRRQKCREEESKTVS